MEGIDLRKSYGVTSNTALYSERFYYCHFMFWVKKGKSDPDDNSFLKFYCSLFLM